MNTQLYLSRNSPLRTTVINASTSRPLYRIETPRKFTRKTTRIYRVPPTGDLEPLLPSSSDSPDEQERSLDMDTHTGGEEHLDLDGPMEEDEMARIHWHHFSPHRVVFNGQLLKRSQLLPKSGTGYTFEVRNTELKWSLGFLGMSTPKLMLNDGSKTVIAQFHRRNFMSGQKAYLELTPMAMDMLDHIIVTFVFADKKRRDREKRARYNSAGGS